MKARRHPQIRPHQSADGVRIGKIDHSGLVRKEVARPDGKPAGRDEGIELVNVRSSWVGWFLHHPQDCGWGSGTTSGTSASELNRSRASCWMLLRCAAAIPSRLRTRPSGISIFRFAIYPHPSALLYARRET